ncbi:TetR/AcrR family transcriptional regulator [Lacticaseibacillus daqingensis]|uniref:TetR/AcrR family transcriptional regulator n=1 Tax=Lacticaseibacillus daqingensis TaxID=2486014 RepID=UPI000F7A8189|nr:TetR-like C-terminal domain-containing protein [Lacticaseibacillus daqingensis]
MADDPRFQRTESALRQTFIRLMAKDGYDKITVTQLISQAKINRTTFYAHYQDKRDLLEALEDDLLNGINTIERALPAELYLRPERILNSPEMITQATPIFAYLRANGRFLALLLDPIKGDPGFVGKLTAAIRMTWERNHIIDRLAVPEGYALAVVTGILSSMINEWVRRNFKESPADFAAIALRIVGTLPHEMIH